MKNYEVRLARPVTQKVTTTVSVFAETEEAAIEKALSHARVHHEEWAAAIDDPATFGEIEVVATETIVDVDEEAA